MQAHFFNYAGKRMFLSYNPPPTEIRRGYLYIMLDHGHKMFKIGYSSTPCKRFKQLWKDTPFEFSIAAMIKIKDVKSAYQLERDIHKDLGVFRIGQEILQERYGKGRFDGYSEWFEINAVTANYVQQLINQARDRNRLVFKCDYNFSVCDLQSEIYPLTPYEMWLAMET